MRNASVLILACLCLPAWLVTPAAAKISSMSGAYDGRGTSREIAKPETAKLETVKPKKVKKNTRKPATMPGAN